MKYVAVYGSLRLNEYNYERMLSMYPNSIEYIKTTKVKDYDLYSLGSYPGIKEGKRELTVDILLVDNAAFATIDNMEQGANYTPVIVEIDGIECVLYVYNGNVNDNKLVKSGDWSNYLKQEV